MQPMTGGDAAWLRMDGPRNEADVLALLAFEGRPSLDRVRHVLEQRLLPVARFRERAVPAASGRPGWAPATAFSLDDHLSRVEVAPGGLAALLGEVTSTPLDPARPLWRVILAEERGGETVLVAKLHHALGDGFALVALLLALADEPVADRAPTARAMPAWGEGARGPAARSVQAVRDAARFAATLARLAALSPAPPQLARAPTGVRRVAWSGPLPLDGLKRAARGSGASLNDLLLAVVAGGMRTWLARGGPLPPRALRAFMPVNFRAERPEVGPAAALGNRFGLLLVDLPVDRATGGERLAAVRAEVAALRSRPDALVTRDVLALCGWLPTPLHHALTSFFARKCSLVLTNVPGPATRIHLAGSPLTRVVFWVPHPSELGLGVSLISYAGDVRIGVRADAAVLADPAALVRAVEDEVAALLADARGQPSETPPLDRAQRSTEADAAFHPLA